MKKILFLLAAVSLTLTSCLKEDDSYKDMPLIYPGLNIYSAAFTQNTFSMVSADEGMRLAMLVAERIKQGKPADFDLSMLTYDNKGYIQEILFGAATKIERDGSRYTLTLNPRDLLPGGYSLDGKITVDTQGNESLENATAALPWKIDASGLVIVVKATSGSQTLTTESGNTELFAKDGGAYGITVKASALTLKINNTFIRRSMWNSNFNVKSAGAGLAYSQWIGSKVTANGEASGNTVFTFDTQGTSAFLTYKLTDGVYQGNSVILSGEEQATIVGEVDAESYPSKTVKISWAFDGQYRQQTVSYNGNTVTF